jgi:hypothetical protein
MSTGIPWEVITYLGGSRGGEYILKPSPEQYPNAAENEHAGQVIDAATNGK